MAIKIIAPRHTETETYYRRNFTLVGEKPGNGYSFPVKPNGELDTDDEFYHCWYANFNMCIEHPEKYIDEGIVPEERTWTEPTLAECVCGEQFYLVDEYMGCCECPSCNKWYNLFGQEVNEPSTWRNGDDW